VSHGAETSSSKEKLIELLRSSTDRLPMDSETVEKLLRNQWEIRKPSSLQFEQRLSGVEPVGNQCVIQRTRAKPWETTLLFRNIVGNGGERWEVMGSQGPKQGSRGQYSRFPWFPTVPAGCLVGLWFAMASHGLHSRKSLFELKRRWFPNGFGIHGMSAMSPVLSEN
jgi:hypothetical protein